MCIYVHMQRVHVGGVYEWLYIDTHKHNITYLDVPRLHLGERLLLPHVGEEAQIEEGEGRGLQPAAEPEEVGDFSEGVDCVVRIWVWAGVGVHCVLKVSYVRERTVWY